MWSSEYLGNYPCPYLLLARGWPFCDALGLLREETPRSLLKENLLCLATVNEAFLNALEYRKEE